MKIKIKNLLIVLLIIVTSFATGCNTNTSIYANRPVKIKLTYFDGGYGSEWINDVTKEYMENYNSEVYVEIKTIVTNSEEGTKVKSGLTSSDIYMLEDSFDLTVPLVDLTDLVKGYPLGEDKFTIEQKMNQSLYKTYDKGDAVFNSIPYSNNIYTYAYNETTINNALGATNWSVPKTTKQFFEIGNRLAEKNIFLTGGSFKDFNDYFNYVQTIWFTQYIGYEAFKQYLGGNYFNSETNSYEFCQTEPLMIEQQKDAFIAMYDGLNRLGNKSNAYLHKDSINMDFMNQEASFYGYGFGVGKMKQAFILNGPWLENEMKVLPKSLGSLGYEPVIKAMKMPIISEMVNVLTSITGSSEEKEIKLQEIISFVDEDTATKPLQVSDADIERVREARRINCSNTSGSICIPNSSKNQAQAIEFIRFLTSDKAQKASMKALSGINMLPYDAMGKIESDVVLSDYVRSMQNIRKNELLAGQAVESKFTKLNKFNVLKISDGDILSRIYGTTAGGKSMPSATAYFNEVKADYTRQWSHFVERYNSSIKK